MGKKTGMKRNSNVQKEFAKYIANLKYTNLPQEIVHEAKYRVLDWLGCALAGAREKQSEVISGLITGMGGASQATVIMGGKKVPVSQAALVNASAGHAVEFDDGHRLAIAHPGAVSVPASLAVAEYVNGSGQDLLTAVVAGYEAMIRLGMALNPSHYRIWHTTGTCGAFASAAAAAHLLTLDEDKTSMALGTAGTMASGLQEAFGSQAKVLQVGHACQSGILAALLAREGFKAPEDILMGNKGFVTATASPTDREHLASVHSALSSSFADSGNFLMPTAFYKIYASCGHTHAPLDAIFRLMEQYSISAESVRKIRIVTYHTSVELTGSLKIESAEEAKFSLPYVTAAALACKKVTLDEFDAEILNNPDVLRVAQAVEVEEDPAMSAKFPRERWATVMVELVGGQKLEETVKTANLRPSDKYLEDKFISLAEKSTGKEKALEIMDKVLNLEWLSNLQTLMELV